MYRCRKMPPLTEAELERFRTKFCVLLRGGGGGCSFGASRCNYSHNAHWTRRCPVYLKDPCALRYLPFLCLHVQLGEGDEILDNNCIHGNFCPFAHSAEEILYHPLVYKIRPCPEYSNGSCSVYYCWKAHGELELRKSRKYTIPSKKGVILPPFPGVQVVDSLNANATVIQNLRDKKCEKRDCDGEKIKQLHDNKRCNNDSGKNSNQEVIPLSNINGTDSVNSSRATGTDCPSLLNSKKHSKHPHSSKIISSGGSLLPGEGITNCKELFMSNSVEYLENKVSHTKECIELELKATGGTSDLRNSETIPSDHYDVFLRSNDISPIIRYETNIHNMNLNFENFSGFSDPSVSILTLAIKLVRVAYRNRIFSYSQWGRLLICEIILLLLTTCSKGTSNTVQDYTKAIFGRQVENRVHGKKRILKLKFKTAGQLLTEARSVSIYQRSASNLAKYPKTFQKYFAIQQICRIRHALVKTIIAYRLGCRLKSMSLNQFVGAPNTILSFFNEQYFSKKCEGKFFSNEKQTHINFQEPQALIPSVVSSPIVKDVIYSGSSPLGATVALTVMEHVWTDFVYAAFSPFPNKSLRFWNQQPRVTQGEWNLIKEGLCPCPPSSAKPLKRTSTNFACLQ